MAFSASGDQSYQVPNACTPSNFRGVKTHADRSALYCVDQCDPNAGQQPPLGPRKTFWSANYLQNDGGKRGAKSVERLCYEKSAYILREHCRA